MTLRLVKCRVKGRKDNSFSKCVSFKVVLKQARQNLFLTNFKLKIKTLQKKKRKERNPLFFLLHYIRVLVKNVI